MLNIKDLLPFLIPLAAAEFVLLGYTIQSYPDS